MCRRPNDPDQPMAQCNICLDWFHPKCVGFKNIQEIAVISPWLCPQCSIKKTQKAKLKKTKLTFDGIENSDIKHSERDNLEDTCASPKQTDSQKTKPGNYDTEKADPAPENVQQQLCAKQLPSQFTITLRREE